jgi:polysaccharide biosynthesis/export protein
MMGTQPTDAGFAIGYDGQSIAAFASAVCSAQSTVVIDDGSFHAPTTIEVLNGMRKTLVIAAVTIGAFVFTSKLALCAEYRIEVGDTIEFNAAAMPQLKTRSTVSLDGTITLPLIGQIKAADLSSDELLQAVRQKISSKVFRRKADDGRDVATMLSPDEVTVTIGEYRPIYVNGDVSQPGERTYRPGMTVRQAIALSGGYDIMRFRSQNPILEQADFRAEYNSQWTSYVEQQATILRLNAELENKPEFDHKAMDKTPVPNSVATRIATIADSQLTASNAIYQKEKAYLESALKTEIDRVAALSQQQQKEKEGADFDNEEVRRVQDLYDQKTVPITRLLDARRAILLSATRYLQTVAQRGQSERDRDELKSKLAKLDDERRAGALAQLQTAEVRLATIRSRLQALGDKLIYTGLVRSQLVRGTGAEPSIVIYRQHGADRSTINADQSAELQPGDVVDVALQKTPSDSEPGKNEPVPQYQGSN